MKEFIYKLGRTAARLKYFPIGLKLISYIVASTSLAYILGLEKISIWIAKSGVKWAERSGSFVRQGTMYSNLSFVYETLGQWELSLQMLEKADMFSPIKDFHFRVAILHERLGQIELALENYKRALTEDNPEIIEPNRAAIIMTIKELETSNKTRARLDRETN